MQFYRVARLALREGALTLRPPLAEAASILCLCGVNDAIAENYTRRGRASYPYTFESFRYYSLLLNNDLRGFLSLSPPPFCHSAARRWCRVHRAAIIIPVETV